MFGAFEPRERHCFSNRCRLLKPPSIPLFGQAHHLNNFGRTKPPSGPRERELVARGAADNRTLIPFEALVFFLITWQSLNLKRVSKTSRGSQV